MFLHGPVRDDPPVNNIHGTEEDNPGQTAAAPQSEVNCILLQITPVGEICLIKRSDAKSDINHGKVKTPARPVSAGKEVRAGSQLIELI